MCLVTTIRRTAVAVAAWVLVVPAVAQVPKPDWRRIGNSGVDLALPSVATGPIERVWYSEDGTRLFARAGADRTFVSRDMEGWVAVPADSATPVAAVEGMAVRRPEPGVRVRRTPESPARVYAIGRFVYRSEDAGAHWLSLTNFKNTSILGEGMLDLAVSPRDGDEIAVSTVSGVWRSVDGGQSWTGLNQDLPNLPVRRILGTPSGSRGIRISIGIQGALAAVEWQPGEKQAWRPVQDSDFERDQQFRTAWSAALGANVTAVASNGDYYYAGSADGRIWVSTDRGRSWTPNADQFAAPVDSISVDPRDPRMAVAALGARFATAPATARAPHVLRTTNGGGFWDDLTANLPDVPAFGIAADRATGAVYVATERGVFMAFEDLMGAGSAAQWSPLSEGLPAVRAADVRLDMAGHQLYVALDGYGVYAAPAPHRLRAPRLVSAADLTDRAAAPGTLLTVVGARVRSAHAGPFDSPVLARSDTKSEIQVPFEARGTSLSLALDAAGGPITFGIPLQAAAPAIFVDTEGAPMVLDADSGVLLDTMRPAHSHARIQILATGLGQVTPQWTSGIPAPVENPPAVAAPVRAFLDRTPVEVSRATLAPGYVGFYLVEVQLPKLVNYGPAELYLEVDGQASNRVRVYIEP